MLIHTKKYYVSVSLLLASVLLITTPFSVSAQVIKKSTVKTRASASVKPVPTKKSTVTKKTVAKKLAIAKPKRRLADEGAPPKGNASRCLTPAMAALDEQAIKQMETDIVKVGAGHEEAAKVYRQNLDTIWAAMAEPYCGYGSLGLTAVKHSFIKSTTKTRETFLARVKTEKPATAVASVDQATAASTTTTIATN